MSATLIATPEPQHMQALEYANQIRLARADIKRRVAGGELSAHQIIAESPPEVGRMTVAELLMSQRRWGRTRCRKLLSCVPISETKTIGSMTERQRNELAQLLRSNSSAN